MGKRYDSMADRLRALVHICEETGCWIWLGAVTYSKNSETPRGRMTVYEDGRSVKKYAHVVSFETFKRRLRKNEEAGHCCNNTICINPEHLKAITASTNMKEENARRAVKRTWVSLYAAPAGCREIAGELVES